MDPSNEISQEEDALKTKQRWERGDKGIQSPIPPMEWQKKAFLMIVASLIYFWVPIYM